MPFLSHIALQLAMAQADAAQPEGFIQSLRESNFVPLLAMIGAMYFILIRPMLKQNKQHQETLKTLKKDDEVITSGGIYGKIHAIEDKLVSLEVANGVRIKVLRTNIAGKWNPSLPVPAAVAQAKE
jgi:preprotein translocase subunit YajC